jgi:hypothetical protein
MNQLPPLESILLLLLASIGVVEYLRIEAKKKANEKHHGSLLDGLLLPLLLLLLLLAWLFFVKEDPCLAIRLYSTSILGWKTPTNITRITTYIILYYLGHGSRGYYWFN